MDKCIDCAYFLNCKKANEEKVCEKYKFIRKNINIGVRKNIKEKEKIKSQIERLIEEKNIEREVADLFYKMCSNVPPQTLAMAVRQTIENFRELDKLYDPNIKKI